MRRTNTRDKAVLQHVQMRTQQAAAAHCWSKLGSILDATVTQLISAQLLLSITNKPVAAAAARRLSVARTYPLPLAADAHAPAAAETACHAGHHGDAPQAA
jgi:hypothetical protein